MGKIRKQQIWEENLEFSLDILKRDSYGSWVNKVRAESWAGDRNVGWGEIALEGERGAWDSMPVTEQ